MGCSSRIQQIVSKGKRGAAEYVKTCRSPEILNEILDRILSHEISINDSESIDWIRWLVAGGNTPENFTAIVKKYNNASTCGLVYSAQTVAYRCRTCSLSPCLSLCADCFLNGQHEGHDYKMFRSDTGGACDCGNSSVMKSSGFCEKHSITDDIKNMVPPPDLLYIAELMAPRIFCRLILHLRNHQYPFSNGLQMAVDADNYLAMLCEFSDMGAAMMRVLTSALTSIEGYRKLTQDWCRDDSAYATYMASSEQLYEEALKSLANPEPPVEFKNCPGLQTQLKHKTFLEELVFWTVKYEFPQKLINFLLFMLPDTTYKETLTEAFVLHYSRIAMVLERATDPDTLSKRVAKVSVQWFSNKELAVRMTENLSLLQVMVVTLKNMIGRTLMPISAAVPKRVIINCESPVICQYRYWLFVSDLNSVLSYQPVAMKFMSDDSLSQMWFSFLSYFQGMNVNQREVDQHAEYERDTDSVFLAELWATSHPTLPLLSHLTDQSTAAVTVKMLQNCLIALESWLQSVAPDNPRAEISFHIPLHRCLATFIGQAVNVQQIPLSEVLPRDDLLRSVILHPLRIQTVFYEIVNGMWVRNGLQIKKQAMTYTQNDFCSAMVDADIYLLQILSTRLPRDEFLMSVIDQFHVSHWFRLGGVSEKDDSAGNDDAFLESFLQFLATLCVNRTNLGNTPLQTIRAEIVTLLCVADRTHSQLVELMPERSGTGKSPEFDVILAEVADYKPPNFKYGGNLQQGLYTPKPCAWDEMYDPMHVLLRTGVNKKDFQNTTDRFIDHVKRFKRLPPGTTSWPPYRIPSACHMYVDPRHLLDCSTFHALLWTVLYKYVHQNAVSEHGLSLAVYLLEMALSVATPDRDDVDRECIAYTDVAEQNLASWFPSSQLSCNLRTVVRTVHCQPTPASSQLSRTVQANESVVSLLLKCHAKLSGSNDSLGVDFVDAVLETRIGSGVAFLRKALTRILLLDEMCRNAVMKCRENLLSMSRASDQLKTASNRMEQCDKKRKAEERRRKIMESLAMQRDKFAKENEGVLGEDKMDWQSCEASDVANKISSKKYYCGICRKMLPSTKENPMVLVTDIQATSVLGHRKSLSERKPQCSLSSESTLAETMYARIEILRHDFDGWTESVNLGWEDGVRVQTCGHSFDHRCLISLKKEEYSCPVCRQRANSILPVLPEDHVTSVLKRESRRQMVSTIRKLLESAEPPQLEADCNVVENVINSSLLDLKGCLNSDLLQRYGVTNESDNLLFLASVARTNLEMDILLRGGSLGRSTQQDVCLVAKKSCIVPLLGLLGVRARMLNRRSTSLSWHLLTGDYTCLSPTDRNRVPLLLCDPVTVLLQLILVLPPESHRVFYSWIVKFVYSLLAFQSAAQLSYHLTETRRNDYRFANIDVNCNLESYSLGRAMKFVIEVLAPVLPYLESEAAVASDFDVESRVQEMCLPFLRVATVLRYQLFDEELPEVPVQSEEFARLMRYLELAPQDAEPTVFNSSVTVVLRTNKANTVECWFDEFRVYAMRSQSVARSLIADLHKSWSQPKLLELSKQYENVFQQYRLKPCNLCQQVCEKPSICLVCGCLVCLQGKCCERNGVYEAVRHSISCGAGTGIYLTVASSNVVIIRGPKACIWGSVFLDSYGEEDPDLKRGRPLYLSVERYHLLEHEWLSHSFDRGDESWILHKDQL